ncbi:MAG: putative zinc-binding protein [Nitrospinales bacterium]
MSSVESRIPVLSCGGTCINGEIAGIAATIVSKFDSYVIGWHEGLVAAPESVVDRLINTAEKVVLIHGCYLKCTENIIAKERLIQFESLSYHNRFPDISNDYEDVPEEERKKVAQSVADWVIDCLENTIAES